MLDILESSYWAVNAGFARRLGPIALKLISEGKNLDFLINKQKLEDLPETRYKGMNISYRRENGILIATTEKSGKVAVIPVLGSMTKRGDMCSYGMRDYIGMINRANANKDVNAILIDMETPGGTVDGTPEFGNAVANSPKPVTIFGDSMVASAGIWVATQAAQIIANKENPTEFGSIGTLCVHEYWGAYIEREIGAVEIIRAPQSTDKARINPLEPLEDEDRTQLVEELRLITNNFIGTVKTGRGDKLQTGSEDIFTGKMYDSKTAKKMGLIDGIDTFENAINKAAQLGKRVAKQNSNSNQISNTMNFPKLAGLFGNSDKTANEDLSTEEQASMEAAEQQVVAMENRATTAEARVAELEAQLAEQATAHEAATKAANEAHEATVAEMQAKLEAAPAGQATTVVATDDKQALDNDAQAIIDNLPHNVAADKESFHISSN